MIEKKFNIPAMIFAAAAILFAFFARPIEGIITAIIAIILTVCKRKTKLVKLPMFLSVLSIAGCGAWLGYFFLMINNSMAAVIWDYWFYEIIINAMNK